MLLCRTEAVRSRQGGTKMVSRRSIGVGVAAALVPMLIAVPAEAKTGIDFDPPTSDATQGRQFGPFERAEFRENHDGSGHRLLVYGGGACTPSTADPDVSYSFLPGSWNDSASWAADYNRCDIKLYWDGGFQGRSRGYENFASGRYLGNYWNDEMSSYRLS